MIKKKLEQNKLNYNIINSNIREIEKEIENKLLETTKRKDAVFNRNKDWGEKNIIINFILDEINLADFERLMNEVRVLIEKRLELRIEQNRIDFENLQISLESKVQENMNLIP